MTDVRAGRVVSRDALDDPLRLRVLRHHARVAVLAGVAAWLPLVVLTVLQRRGGGAFDPAYLDGQISVHVRSLLCVPLLIMAEGLCMPRLWRIVDHFLVAGLVVHRERFLDARARTQRALASPASYVCIVLLAYVATAALVRSLPRGDIPAWHRGIGDTAWSFSPAGWWHVLVSLPLVLALMFAWGWRLCLWAVLLWRIVRCEPRPMASHPDHLAGLGFLGGSLRAFAPVGLAFSAVVASRAAQLMASGVVLSAWQIYFDVGCLVVVAILFIAPLLVFSPTLMRTRVVGGLAYSALAQHVGRAFERRWLSRGDAAGEDDALHVQDFSATTDLYSIVDNAARIRLVPVSRRDLMTLAAALAIPFVPVVLMRVPLNVFLSELRGVLL